MIGMLNGPSSRGVPVVELLRRRKDVRGACDVAVSTYVSICSGGGGLDRGVELGSCGTTRPVLYMENEVTAASLLVARFADGSLPEAPIWSDVRRFEWARLRGRVDGFVGGYPCQPFSVAGRRLGEDDPRHLWPSIRDAIGAVRPRWCFFENVGGHLRLGGREVLNDLRSMGYTPAVALLRASDVGAPHRRERLFILAVAGTDRLDDAEPPSGGSGSSRGVAASAGAAVADTSEQPQREPHDEGRPESWGDSRADAGGDSGAVGDADEPGPQGRGEPERERGYERPAWPPGPQDADAWARVLARRPDLAPAVESAVRGVADGVGDRFDLTRADRLRILGNGVVPQQAALAWRLLWEELR